MEKRINRMVVHEYNPNIFLLNLIRIKKKKNYKFTCTDIFQNLRKNEFYFLNIRIDPDLLIQSTISVVKIRGNFSNGRKYQLSTLVTFYIYIRRRLDVHVGWIANGKWNRPNGCANGGRSNRLQATGNNAKLTTTGDATDA